MLIPYQSSAVKSAATFLAWDMLAALETTSLGRGLLPKQKHGAKIRKYPLGGPARKLDQSYVKINLNTPLINSAARDMLEHIHKLLCKCFFSTRQLNPWLLSKKELMLASSKLRHLFKHFFLQASQVIKPSCHGKRTRSKKNGNVSFTVFSAQFITIQSHARNFKTMRAITENTHPGGSATRLQHASEP